ncbi:hypothetical protein C900_02087 [Fulvivirga imtechensis AK7]|uniref:Uncharacterized protein n=1 Tax=Fulvivirga imtechensis AK7 TaxID=1237149 RepID=L8JZV8_9BACT|nr:hypothetical protein C900_02087 [Fulvivirga imtechensis AK7]
MLVVCGHPPEEHGSNKGEYSDVQRGNPTFYHWGKGFVTL